MTDNWLFLCSLVFRKRFLKSEIKDFWKKLMPIFCCKPQVASFYSSLIQPYTKLCHRQNSDKHTDEIIHPVHFKLASLYFLALKKIFVNSQWFSSPHLFKSFLQLRVIVGHLLRFILIISIHLDPEKE